ncbi:MAG: hypothetical protein ISR76_01280 [Planctomycetes bacterium]|nr:hypothetical protein [Planctomycetota bacterium]MBL7007601.1 hypothetical protein [Planctomycetota bacterium]
MSVRKLLFLAGMVGVPCLFWAGTVEGSLERRVAARQRLESIDGLTIQNRRTVGERDQLRAGWQQFKPVADEKLDNLDYTLNPLLIQSHVVDAANRIGLRVDIRQENLGVGDRPPSWFFSGRADYRKAVEFILELENNALRVRFEKVEFTLPTDELERRTGQVRFFAVMNIPSLPGAVPQHPEKETD